MNDVEANEIVHKLDQEFYKNFDTHYFTQKNEYLFFLLCNLDEYMERAQAGMKYEDIEISGGELEKDEKIKLKNHLQAEIALNYYHALETLFRLLLGHADVDGCPWVTIATTTNFGKFKEDINKLIQGEGLSIKDKNFEESLVAILFGRDYSEEKGKEKWNENIKRSKKFLKLFAKNLLETPHYNSYKHGLAIFHDNLSVKYGNFALTEREDAFTFIETRQQGGEKHLVRTNHFIKWKERFYFTLVVTRFIENIINVGKIRYLGEKNLFIAFFDEYEIEKIQKANKNGVILDSISVGL